MINNPNENGTTPNDAAETNDVNLEVENTTPTEQPAPVETTVVETAETVEPISETTIDNPTEVIEPAAEVVETPVEPTAETALEAIEPTADVVDDTLEPVAETETYIEQPTPTEIIGEEPTLDVESANLNVEEQAEHHIEQTNYSTLGKDELLVEMAKLVDAGDVKAARIKVRVIRDFLNELINKENRERLVDFLNGGGLKEEFEPAQDSVKVRFDALYVKFRELESQERNKRERELAANLVKKKDILEELRTLIENESDDRKLFEKFHDIQSRWRQIGNIPPADVTHVWRNYNHYTTLIYNQLRQHRELRDLDMKKNLELKSELCQKAEELIAESQVKKSLDEAKRLQDQWKQIGPAPRAVNDEIWARFKSALDKVYERKNEFYKGVAEQQQANLNLKLALCESAEEIANKDYPTAAELKAANEEVDALVQKWRAIGYAPKEQNDEVWKRFRAATKVFFDKREDFYQDIKTEQQNNIKRKTDIIQQAEALASSTDWKRTGNELIRLQQEWKTIGPVSKKISDKLWLQFRTACDTFFNNKSAHFNQLSESEAGNLTLKNELVDKINALELGENPKDLLDSLNQLQNEWAQIGHVPIKEKDEVYKRYRTALDSKFELVKGQSAQFGADRFKTKVEAMRGATNGNDQLKKERQHWQNKATKLRSDISTLENNIEFFARSKNADELRKNVETQVNTAKKELAEIEDKLKLLREAGV